MISGRVPKLSWGKLTSEADLIFLAANRREDLDGIGELKASLAADGGLWIVRPKGAAEISERDVRERARAAGLLDVKVCAFSATHTAEKLVVPRAKRG
jgi:hypothetical protein